jgi:type II secretory pathway component PulF
MTVARMDDPRHEAAAADQTAPAQLRSRGGNRRLKSLALLSRQLAVLVRTGTPLADALNAIERQIAPGPWKAVVADLHRQVEQGSSLSEAMARHPTWFDPVCLSLVTVGESSGNLDELLERLSNLIRQQLKIRRAVIGAMLYPVLLLAVGIAVVAVMVCFVLPRFADLFANLDAPLPPSTKVLIVMSDTLRADWWIFLGAIVMTAVAAKVYAATASGRRGLHSAAVSVPYLGEVVRNLITARLARLLGVLLDSRVPMLDSLKLLRDSTGNCHYAELIGRAEEAVARGESLSSALGTSPLINPYVAEALRHGERSGQISPVLLDMAEFMDEENEVVVRTASRLLEPLMLIVLGAIVAVIALSIFMPLFDLTSLTHGGGA